MYPQKRAILLDALGTLVALEPPAPALRYELARRLQVSVTLAEAEHAIAAEIAYYRRHLDEGRDDASLAALRRRCAVTLRDALPHDSALDDISPLTEALLASLRFSLFAEVPDALAGFRERGLAVAVVSNWDVSLHAVLEELGVTPLVDAILTSAEAGARKPSAVIFERALGLIGARPADAVHVGDSLEEDVLGARAAGIEPVLVRRDGGSGSGSVRTIASLAELLPPGA
jgi:putative hydrolase of the HAD superfamily